MFNCPVTDLESYRDGVFGIMPELKYLDGFDADDGSCVLVFSDRFRAKGVPLRHIRAPGDTKPAGAPAKPAAEAAPTGTEQETAPHGPNN